MRKIALSLALLLGYISAMGQTTQAEELLDGLFAHFNAERGYSLRGDMSIEGMQMEFVSEVKGDEIFSKLGEEEFYIEQDGVYVISGMDRTISEFPRNTQLNGMELDPLGIMRSYKTKFDVSLKSLDSEGVAIIELKPIDGGIYTFTLEFNSTNQELINLVIVSGYGANSAIFDLKFTEVQYGVDIQKFDIANYPDYRFLAQ